MAVAENPVVPPWRRTYDVDLGPDPHPLRHPARLLTVLGAVATIVGALVLPWFNYGVDAFHSSLNAMRTGNKEGLDGDTWGIYAIVVALFLIAAVSSRAIADSRIRWIQFIPAALGIAALVFYLEVAREVPLLVNLYQHSGFVVTDGPGLDVMLAAAIVSAVGGIASSMVTKRKNDPAASPGPKHPEG
jgi:hypothetical protein